MSYQSAWRQAMAGAKLSLGAAVVAGIATAAIFATTSGAQAVPVPALIDSSPQNGVGINEAHLFAPDYMGYTPAGASWSAGVTLVEPPPGNLTNVFKSPFNDTPLQESQSFFSVGGPNSTAGSATLTFEDVQYSFNILWGSIDSYNTISFFDSTDFLIESWTGTDIINLFGLGGSPVNYEVVALLNFSGFADGFKSVLFESTQAAFEFALPIPLPAGLILFLSGLFGIGILGRYKAKRRLEEPATA